jgi:DNA-binding Xre family transcriptional regulator
MYGEVVCVLSEIWTDYQTELIKRTGINKNTVTALFNNKLKRIDLDVLAKICFVTNKNPGDILRYIRVDSLEKFENILNFVTILKKYVSDETIEQILVREFNMDAGEAQNFINRV